MKLVLNTNEAAELLCCEPSTARELARTGVIPAVKFGHDWVFPVYSLIDAVNELAQAQSRGRKPGPSNAAPVPAAPLYAPREQVRPTFLTEAERRPISLDAYVFRGRPQ